MYSDWAEVSQNRAEISLCNVSSYPQGRLPFHLASGRPAVALELMLAYPEGSELPDPLLGPSVINAGGSNVVLPREGRTPGRVSLIDNGTGYVTASKFPMKRAHTVQANVGDLAVG